MEESATSTSNRDIAHAEGRVDGGPISEGLRGAIQQEVSRRKMLGLLGSGAAVGAISVSLPGFLAACAPSAPSPSGKVVETITIAIPGSVRKVDSLISEINHTTVNALALEGLLTFGNNFQLVPALAESWTQPDLLTLIYNLRSGVKFWDGTPLTPDDVVNSINLAATSPDSTWGFFFGNFKSIEASGPMQVTIKLANPDPTFKYIVAIGGTRVFSKAFAAKQPISELGTSKVLNMGTGPYKFTAFQPDASVSLERNDLYWGPKPIHKKIELKILPDEATRELAMRSGTIDGAWALPLPNTPAWETIPNTKVYYAPGATVIYWAFNFDTPPFDDIHVRRAFAHCIDRKGLVQALLHGHGTEAFGMDPPEVWGDVLSYADALAFYKSTPQFEFNIDQARNELAQSKVPNGFSTEVTYPDYAPELGLMAQNVSQNLKQIGINLKVTLQPTSLWTAQLTNNVAPLQVYPWLQDYGDPIEEPLLFCASSGAGPGGFNFAHYRNPTMDSLLTQQAMVTGSQRRDLIKQIHMIMATDLPYQPVWWADIDIALNHAKIAYNILVWAYIYQTWGDDIVPA